MKKDTALEADPAAGAGQGREAAPGLRPPNLGLDPARGQSLGTIAPEAEKMPMPRSPGLNPDPAQRLDQRQDPDQSLPLTKTPGQDLAATPLTNMIQFITNTI